MQVGDFTFTFGGTSLTVQSPSLSGSTPSKQPGPSALSPAPSSEAPKMARLPIELVARVASHLASDLDLSPHTFFHSLDRDSTLEDRSLTPLRHISVLSSGVREAVMPLLVKHLAFRKASSTKQLNRRLHRFLIFVLPKWSGSVRSLRLALGSPGDVPHKALGAERSMRPKHDDLLAHIIRTCPNLRSVALYLEPHHKALGYSEVFDALGKKESVKELFVAPSHHCRMEWPGKLPEGILDRLTSLGIGDMDISASFINSIVNSTALRSLVLEDCAPLPSLDDEDVDYETWDLDKRENHFGLRLKHFAYSRPDAERDGIGESSVELMDMVVGHFVRMSANSLRSLSLGGTLDTFVCDPCLSSFSQIKSFDLGSTYAEENSHRLMQTLLFRSAKWPLTELELWDKDFQMLDLFSGLSENRFPSLKKVVLSGVLGELNMSPPTEELYDEIEMEVREEWGNSVEKMAKRFGIDLTFGTKAAPPSSDDEDEDEDDDHHHHGHAAADSDDGSSAASVD